MDGRADLKAYFALETIKGAQQHSGVAFKQETIPEPEKVIVSALSVKAFRERVRATVAAKSANKPKKV